MSKIENFTDNNQKEQPKKETIFTIFNNLLVCTFQTAFGYICLDLCVAISLHYIVKELGEIANSGYGFAMTCINILILPVGFGFNQSLNMHTSQALGDKKISLAKRFFNINFYSMLLFLIPLSLVLLGILKYPLALTIEEKNRDETSDYALEFLFYLIPAVLLALQFEGAKIFMVSHKVTYPFIYIHFVTFALHWFFTWLFMVQFGWKIFGAGLAIILTEIFNILGLLTFIGLTNIKRDVFQGVTLGFNMKRFKKLGFSYIKTSIPIVLHILSEFFVFFLLSFVALSLGTASMNAHLGLQSVCGIFFRVPLSLSIALMSFVGTEMGKGNIQKAKVYVMIGLSLFAMTTIVCSLFLSYFREELADFYSPGNDDEYGAKSYDLFIDTVPWLIAGVIVADGLQGSLSGALKGINLVNFVFFSTVLAYYVVCIPIVCYFAYDWGMGKGVVGIWQGFGVANVLLAALFLILLFTTNWEKESTQILDRVKRENELQKSTLFSGFEEQQNS